MSFLRVNGGVVHYRDEGPRAGRSIVLINALGSDLRIWDDVAARLAGDFRISATTSAATACPKPAPIPTT